MKYKHVITRSVFTYTLLSMATSLMPYVIIFVLFLVSFSAADMTQIHRKHHSIGNGYSNPAIAYSDDINNNRPIDPIQHVPLTIQQMNDDMDNYRLRHHRKPWWLGVPDSSFGIEDYSDKQQLTAFLFTFFLGICGAGRLYVEDTTGYFKLGLCVIVCCYPCFMCLCFSKKIGNRRTIKFKDLKGVCGILITFFGFCAYLALIGWVVVDIVLFALNEIPDGDGLTLHPWDI
eukprot:436958_1